MQDNPFYTLNRMMQQKQEDGGALSLGEVLTKKPLTIRAGGLVMEPDELRIAAGLSLDVGDEVLIVTFDGGQTFVIIIKVVNTA